MASYGYDDAMAESRQAYDQGLKDGTVPFDMEFEEYLELMQDSKQAPQQDSGIMQAAYGGMMRQKYGLGKFVRKLIPNEIARAAEVAAPFVAPFNPLAAGLMGGIGSFDRTGNLGGAFKSGLMNYGGGQLARGIGGGFGNLQTGFDPRGGMQGMGSGLTKYFSNPMQKTGGLGKMFADKSTTSFTQDGGNQFTQFTKDITNPADTAESLKLAKEASPNNIKLLDKFLGKAGLNTAAMAGIVGASALAGIYTAKNPADDSIEQMRGEGLDVESIRTEVVEAFKDPSGKLLAELRIKYPFLGARETKNIDIMAEGGRIGLYAGGQSIPSPYTMEDARKSSMQDKMGGMEKDYRNDGGFVPIGGKEKADDVPARLSRNEFVFTADAVRGAGGGDIDTGAEIMENIMKNLEQGGQISEETQGLGGAQEMFETSQRLGEVV
jgi:hypothetical protein